MTHLTNGGRYLTSFRRQKTETVSQLRANVDIKRKLKEVRAKFGVGPFQIKNDEAHVNTVESCISATRQ